MKLYRMLLFFVICEMNSIVAMEVALQSPWYSLSKELVTGIVAPSEDNDKEALRSVNKQLSVIASKKNIDNLLQHPYKMSRNYLRNCMVTYAVAKNKNMINHALRNALPWNLKDLLEVVYYVVEPSAFSPSSRVSNIEEYYQKVVLNMMEVYGGEPAVYSAYRERCKANVRKNDAPSLLQIAVSSQHLPVVKLLLEQERQGLVDLHTTVGLLPLHSAVTYFCASEAEALPQSTLDKSAAIVELLCEHSKANINEVDGEGNTALMNAVALDNPVMVKLLLHYKASPIKHNYYGLNACDIAKSKEIQRLLGAEVLSTGFETLNNGLQSVTTSVVNLTTSVVNYFS
jgi:hypothetical protein